MSPLARPTALAELVARPKVEWYGEIVDCGSHVGTTRTDMGNGHWPYEGWQHCAYMRQPRYQSTDRGWHEQGTTRGSVWESHPNCYGIEGALRQHRQLGPYFWWGGSGKNSRCP